MIDAYKAVDARQRPESGPGGWWKAALQPLGLFRVGDCFLEPLLSLFFCIARLLIELLLSYTTRSVEPKQPLTQIFRATPGNTSVHPVPPPVHVLGFCRALGSALLQLVDFDMY